MMSLNYFRLCSMSSDSDIAKGFTMSRDKMHCMLSPMDWTFSWEETV